MGLAEAARGSPVVEHACRGHRSAESALVVHRVIGQAMEHSRGHRSGAASSHQRALPIPQASELRGSRARGDRTATGWVRLGDGLDLHPAESASAVRATASGESSTGESSLGDDVIDLAVAGAGPVGLAVAIAAARAGLQVQVFDPRTAPIDKACGEGLMPEALARLWQLGIDPAGLDFTGIRYIAPGGSAVAHFDAGPGRGVRRTLLQDLMQTRAQDLGVQLSAERITSVVQRTDSVQVDGINARYLVGADGLHSQVRGALRIPVHPGRWHRYGIRQHFEVQPWTDVVEVYWLPDAELYVTPVDVSTVGVAVLGTAPLDLASAIARVPALAWRLKDARRVSSTRGAGPMHTHVARKRAGRALLVGDASGYVDALTGEGLRMGFAQAHAAVSCILAGDLDNYESEWHRITRSYRMLTSTLLFAARHARVRRALVPAAQAAPWMFTRIVNLL